MLPYAGDLLKLAKGAKALQAAETVCTTTKQLSSTARLAKGATNAAIGAGVGATIAGGISLATGGNYYFDMSQLPKRDICKKSKLYWGTSMKFEFPTLDNHDSILNEFERFIGFWNGPLKQSVGMIHDPTIPKPMNKFYDLNFRANGLFPIKYAEYSLLPYEQLTWVDDKLRFLVIEGIGQPIYSRKTGTTKFFMILQDVWLTNYQIFL